MSTNIDILFIRPRQARALSLLAGICTEPLELEQLAAVATQSGHTWRIYDQIVDRRSLRKVLTSLKPRFIAITGYYPMRPAMWNLARQARKQQPDAILIAGGVDVEIDTQAYQESPFDIAVFAGGAATFQSLLESDRAGTSLNRIPGTIWRSPLVVPPSGGPPSTTTNPPLPNRSHLQTYQHRFRYLDHGPVALLKSAYGCPYDCSFCCCKLLNQRSYTPRPIESIITEISQLPTKTIWIVDDTFLADGSRAKAFAEQIIAQNISKQFIIYARAAEIVRDPSLLALLKRAGIVEIIVGLEAVDPDRLHAYHKQASAEDNARCVTLLREAGIRCVGLFMIEPDATAQEFRRLRHWIRKHHIEIFSISIFSPFPGTDEYQKQQDRLISRNPRHWDLRHLVLPPANMNTFAFYFRYYALSAAILRHPKFVATVLLQGITPMQARIWDFWAPRYHRLWVQRVSLQPTRKAVLIAIKDHATRPLHILDVGCGPGQMLGDLQQAGLLCDYIGVDASGGMIRQARKDYPDATFRVEPMEFLTAPPASMDVVICLHALPYAQDPVHAMQRMTACLKPGGHLLVASAATLTFYDRCILRLVKLTTSRATYPNHTLMQQYTRNLPLTNIGTTMLSKRPMPALCLWHWRKELPS